MRQSRERLAFISYASENREKAEEIRASLEAQGLVCWIAPRDLRAGREYADEIIHGIERSTSVVLVLSGAANTSVFVDREIERAFSKQKPIFPVRIEEVTPSASLELFISGTQWIDAWTGRWDDHMNRLARDLATDGAAGTTASRISTGQRSPAEHQSFRTGYVAAALVLIAALSGLAIWSFRKEGPPQQREAPIRAESPARPPNEKAPPAIVETQPELEQARPATTINASPPLTPETGTRRPTEPRRQEVPQPVAPPTRSAANPSAPGAGNTRELSDLQEAYDDLSLRGGVIDDTLNRLWEEMKPASPRLDMATHQRSLKTSLSRGKDALEAKNAAGARRYLESARADLAVLEQFLNR